MAARHGKKTTSSVMSRQSPAAPAKNSRRPAASEALPGMRELLDMDQAVALLKTSRPTFYRWLRAGLLKGVKLGRQWRFYRDDIERFVRGQSPRVELPANIKPLLAALQSRLDKLGVKGVFGSPSDDVAGAVARMIRLGCAMRASDLHIAPHCSADPHALNAPDVGGAPCTEIVQRGTRSGHATDGADKAVAVIRYRVDGALNVLAEFDLRLLPAIVEKWKSLAACNVQENRRPQDGRILVNLTDLGKPLDLRVSFMPAVLGEAVTVRFLDRAAVVLSLDRINYAPRDMDLLMQCLCAASGIVLVTGPTGCGKTTTLYACVNQVAGPTVKVVSIEDPVEFLLPWVVQSQLNVPAGVTFATAMRSALRADPDVILVGEIRDRESMMVAQQTALTGHLVLTSLHTEDAPSALKRMVDIGTDPFVVADSSKLIIAQRLVRRLCPECSKEQMPPDHILRTAADLASSGGLDWASVQSRFREPVGCPKCGKFGYKGREVIAEALEVTPEIGAALGRKASVDEMRAIAVRQGMTTMLADGIRKAAAGTTSLEEVLRVIGLR